MSETITPVSPAVSPAPQLSPTQDPWVSDLESSFTPGDCQSTVGFDDHPCAGDPMHYVQIEVWQERVANPRWEGKLCDPCLTGWLEWAAEEPTAVRVVSVELIVG